MAIQSLKKMFLTKILFCIFFLVIVCSSLASQPDGMVQDKRFAQKMMEPLFKDVIMPIAEKAGENDEIINKIHVYIDKTIGLVENLKAEPSLDKEAILQKALEFSHGFFEPKDGCDGPYFYSCGSNCCTVGQACCYFGSLGLMCGGATCPRK